MIARLSMTVFRNPSTWQVNGGNPGNPSVRVFHNATDGDLMFPAAGERDQDGTEYNQGTTMRLQSSNMSEAEGNLRQVQAFFSSDLVTGYSPTFYGRAGAIRCVRD